MLMVTTAARMPRIEMTTSSSIRVNPFWLFRLRRLRSSSCALRFTVAFSSSSFLVQGGALVGWWWMAAAPARAVHGPMALQVPAEQGPDGEPDRAPDGEHERDQAGLDPAPRHGD